MLDSKKLLDGLCAKVGQFKDEVPSAGTKFRLMGLLLYSMFARSKYGGDYAATELMSCKNGMLPLCVAKVLKNLQLSLLLVLYRCDFR